MLKKISLAILSTYLAHPAQAAEVSFRFSGQVDYLIDPSNLGDVKNSDQISAEFLIDPNEAVLGACNQLGGGLACTYTASVRNYSLSIGQYAKRYNSLDVVFYINDNVFGSDALGFAYTELSPGPFNSDLTGIQWQARYAEDTLSSIKFESTLPFERADWSLFALFRNFVGQTQVRGPLVADVSAGVPDPSIWLTMLAGFMVTGGWLRRRFASASTTAVKHNA